MSLIVGAAVIFLQLCILTTCLLCLYSGRRSASSKRRLSRTASVVTSASGGSHLTSPTPTLHTLYHDQLTYRWLSVNCKGLSFLLVLMFPLVSLTRSLHASDLILLTQTSRHFCAVMTFVFLSDPLLLPRSQTPGWRKTRPTLSKVSGRLSEIKIDIWNIHDQRTKSDEFWKDSCECLVQIGIECEYISMDRILVTWALHSGYQLMRRKRSILTFPVDQRIWTLEKE